MLLLRLAARNLFRHTRRTVLTVIVIIVAVGVLILGRAFIDGIEESIVVGAIDGMVGHVMARPAGYPALGVQHPIDELLSLDAAARAFLDREAKAWTERTLFAPVLVHGPDSLRVRAIAYDPERDPKVFLRTLWSIEGAEPVPGREQIMVAVGVAKLLRLKVGDVIVAQTRTHKGALNAMRFEVSGVFRSKNAGLDLNTMLVPMKTARELIRTSLPSHVVARLDRRDRAAEVASGLAARLGKQADVVTWQEETAELIALQRIRRRALGLIVFVLMVLAAFGIANTILMAAYERVRELGTLRAMGMTGGGVISLFLWEGLFMGLVGAALGAGWGSACSIYLSRHPVDMSSAMQTTSGALSFSTLIYARFDPVIATVAVVFGVVVAVLASIYPARIASRVSPAQAIHAE